MAILVHISDSENSLLRFVGYLVGLGVNYLIYWGGKKFITQPRIGRAKFGSFRQR